MLVFLDTEFTSFVRPDLISLGLVSEDGREFYAERTDYFETQCSDFVRETVQPLLGRVPGAACSQPALTDRVREWFKNLPEPATVVFDSEKDWLLLAVAMLGRPHSNHPVTSPNDCTWIAPSSPNRYLSKRTSSPTPRLGRCTMRWPMRGR